MKSKKGEDVRAVMDGWQDAQGSPGNISKRFIKVRSFTHQMLAQTDCLRSVKLSAVVPCGMCF